MASTSDTGSSTAAAADAPGVLVQDDSSGRVGVVVAVTEPDANGAAFPVVAWLPAGSPWQLPVTILRP